MRLSCSRIRLGDAHGGILRASRSRSLGTRGALAEKQQPRNQRLLLPNWGTRMPCCCWGSAVAVKARTSNEQTARPSSLRLTCIMCFPCSPTPPPPEPTIRSPDGGVAKRTLVVCPVCVVRFGGWFLVSLCYGQAHKAVRVCRHLCIRMTTSRATRPQPEARRESEPFSSLQF